jgi:hypothetical protein
MKTSAITLVLELSIYVWLYIYRYDEMFAPSVEIGAEAIFFWPPSHIYVLSFERF